MLNPPAHLHADAELSTPFHAPISVVAPAPGWVAGPEFGWALGRESDRTIRVLHSVGHLLRGGVERWLYGVVRRLTLPRFEHHVLVWTEEEEEFTAEFRAAGVNVIPCLHPRSPLRFASNFRRILRERGPFDVVHTHGTHFHSYVMLLASMSGVGTRVAHSHTDIRGVVEKASAAYRVYAKFGHYGIRKLSRLGFGVSRSAAESMFNWGWQRDARWNVLYCGVDLDPFCRPRNILLRRRLGIPEGRTVVGHVGRFEAQKNHLFLLDVAEAALGRNPNLQFLLVGDGQLREAVIRQAGQRGLCGNFTFVRDSSDVPSLMLDAMDSFIFPSFYEGLPLAAVEAQAAGLPCLISDGVSDEVVVNPRTARRLPLSAGADVWARALTELPPSEELPSGTAEHPLKGSRYDIGRSVKELASWYERMAVEPRKLSDRSR